MKKANFPYLALAMGVVFVLLVVMGSEVNAEGITTLPLLTLLIVSEFAFFVTAIGAYLGVRNTLEVGFKAHYVAASLACALLSIFFLWTGLRLWPN